MLKYKLVQRKDMTKGALEGSKLYYPQVINQGRVSFDSLCEEVAEQSSLTSGDIKNCMDRLINCLVRHLKEGRSVDCGDLGSFRINIRSTGADTPEAYDAATMMRKPSVQYYLGKKLRDMQDTGVQYERYTPPSNE
ncbi:HU family DNA-binding protein [Parabacteroides sp. AGMB00274]|uniref:HU family DNA-binding protein n=1 Tax=Parabacteroides faecalis TaxID=2924040 RepID=A0ABT0C674_9BACT|nr:HU family DNA-binding protein [Parabacteroides faecalis]MCJ2382487.1 HU family DNA-binding protein [Parabacteroides faecalis]